MLSKRRSLLLLFLCSLSFVGLAQGRTHVSFNSGWKFLLGDDNKAKDEAYDDSKWRVLTVPHDWSIEGKFDEKNLSTQAEGGLPTGIGWYRKMFTVPASAKGKKVFVTFDGVYRNSTVWVNGHLLGNRPNGYISFQYDLTPYLKLGNKNVIAVKVDCSEQPDSRWYTGCGIYRNVWLTTTSASYFTNGGTFITTPLVSAKSATVHINTDVFRGGLMRVNTLIYDAAGKLVATKTTVLSLADSLVTTGSQDITIATPKLWSVNTPHLYKVVLQLLRGNKVVDIYEINIGIRDFNFDKDKGFSLNSEQLKIKGVCMHHDLGALGAAINTRAIERQLEILKAMGCNAIRTSHNPPAPEFLQLCDKMGFLVMDEAFDMWRKKKSKHDYYKYFAEWHKKDLEDQIKRDRNHPSVFMWSIGNEIREQFDSTGIAIARELTRIVKSLDNTRPVTSALTETDPKKNFIYQSGALDVLGFNYHHEKYADFPKNFPGEKFIASETMSALETRGFYDEPADTTRLWPASSKEKYAKGNAQLAVTAYDNVAAYWGSNHEDTWKVIKKYDYLSGLFVWTGFDYLGEPTPYPWPARSSYFGIVDLAGFPKDVYYMYQSEWTNKPVLHVLPHWNWEQGKVVDVWAYYNNAEEVELYLNGKSVGTRHKQGDDLHVSWKVPFVAGELKAVSKKDGKIVLVKRIKTAGAPAQIQLTADRSTIAANGKDLSFITVKILDRDGNMVPNADNLVDFNVTGEGLIAGVDNGYQASMEPFKADYRKAYNGMCLAIVQSKNKVGKVVFKASSKGLKSASLTLVVK